MGVQEEMKCSRKSQEVQSSTIRKRVFSSRDFGDIFSSIAKLTWIIFLLSLVASFDLEVEKMDVKKMFLHGDLDEEIYMK